MNIYDMAEITDRTVQDALVFGMGVMVIRNDAKRGLVFEHIARDQYEAMIEALRWQKDENKGNVQ